MTRFGAVVLLVVAGAWAGGAQEPALPNRPASLKFAAIGDNGTGDSLEYDIGREMAAYHRRFSFELVIMLGTPIAARRSECQFPHRRKSYHRLLATRLLTISPWWSVTASPSRCPQV